MAGLIISCSSVPSRPPSPAWGLSANTAILGLRTPKSSLSDFSSCPMRFTMSSLESAAATSDTGRCMVARPTFIISLHISISPSPSNSRAKNSVCPVAAKPSPLTQFLLMGAVTSTSIVPSFTSATALRNDSTATAPPSEVASPAVMRTSPAPHSTRLSFLPLASAAERTTLKLTCSPPSTVGL